MSLITTVEATPSRVLGMFRYLVAHSPLPLEKLAGQLWPKSTRSSNANFDNALRLEMIEAGLLEESDEGLKPHSNLPKALIANTDAAEKHLPEVIADLIMKGGQRNRDLAYGLAWYLSLDPRNAPGDDAVVIAQSRSDGVEDLISVSSNATYGMFEDWTKFLGFGWLLPPVENGTKMRLVPDPTQYLRWILPKLLPAEGKPMAIGDFRKKLAEIAPVFEGGALREEVDARRGQTLNDNQIAPTTAYALLRLVDEGAIELTAPSDAPVHNLPFGEPSRISFVARNSPRSSDK